MIPGKFREAAGRTVPWTTGIRRLHARRRGQGGFTLVELLVVVAILAILASIAIPMYTGFIQKARETAAIGYLKTLHKSQDLYRFDSASSVYSGDFEELEAMGGIPPGSGSASRVDQDYKFDLTAGPGPGGQPTWQALATPLKQQATARFFYIDETGVIRFEIGSGAGAGSAPI